MLNLSLKKRILIPLMVTATLFLVAIIAVSYHSHMKNLSDDINSSVRSVQVYFERSLHQEAEKLSAGLGIFTKDKDLVAMLKVKKQGDIPILPLFDILRKDHNITQLSIYDPDLVNLFRLDNAPLTGKKNSRFTVIEAKRTNKMFSGIELDLSGAISLNIVIPLYNGQSITGYAEFSEDISHIVKNIKDIFHVDLYLLIKKQFLIQSEWEKRVGADGLISKWELLASSVIAAWSPDVIPAKLLNSSLFLKYDIGEADDIRQVVDGTHYSAKNIVLKDASKRVIGDIFVIRDITSKVNKIRLRLSILGAVIIVIGLLTVSLFNFIMGRVEFDIRAADLKRLEDGKKRLSIQAKHIIELRHKQEELQRLKDEAEELNRLKSDFLNIMSHELKTPLTVMLGNVPLLTDENDLPEPVEISEIAQDIETAAKNLLELVSSLLDISKIDAGKMKLQKSPICAASIVEEVVLTAQASAEKKGLEIKTEVEDLDIYADHKRLKQIIQNLLSNAVKFTDTGNITIRVVDAGNEARFQVIDTGSGMKKESLPFIFDVFRQIDSSSTRSAQGTGLGLTITKRLVEMHGGEISVDTEPGVGSTFAFSIPLASSLE